MSLSSLFALLGAVIFIAVLMSAQNKAQTKHYILMMAFAAIGLGWRGASLSSGVTVYPAELIIWVGFGVLGFNAALRLDTVTPRIAFPAFMLAFIAIINFLMDYVTPSPFVSTTSKLFEFKSFMVFVPTVIVMQAWVNDRQQVLSYVKILVFVGFFISALGTLEYLFPSFFRSLGFFRSLVSRNNFAGGGFVLLSNFSTWGTPVVAVMLVPIFVLWFTIPPTQHQKLELLIWRLIGLTLILGIVLSGYRSAWLGLGTAAGGLFLLYRSRSLFTLFIIVSSLAVLPEGFINRIKTILLLEASGDTSILNRTAAARQSISLLLESPLLGQGWTKTVVPFNDWLWIGLSVGFIGLSIFVIWYGTVLLRLWQAYQFTNYQTDHPMPNLAVGFWIALVAYGVCMVSGAMAQVGPLLTAFWLLLVLAERYAALEWDPDSNTVDLSHAPYIALIKQEN